MAASLPRSSPNSSRAAGFDAGHTHEGADDHETGPDAARLMGVSRERDRRRTTAGGRADETYVPI